MRILLVDDSNSQRMLLAAMLRSRGYTDVVQAKSAAQAFEILGIDQPALNLSIDLILMDLNMPEMDGKQAILRIKAIEELYDIPIIVITASDDKADLSGSFEAGAMDYITKPPDPLELVVRVRSALKLKSEMDQRKEREARLKQVLSDLDRQHHLLLIEQEKSERLLLNILPPPIALRLKNGQKEIADLFQQATVLFADVMNFTGLSSGISPQELLLLLNELFEIFDRACDKYGLEKIKTMGDAYIAVAGLPTPRADHIECAARMALETNEAVARHCRLRVRIGLHTGPVVAGVVGIKKFAYDMWGNTVNVASRMQSSCDPQQIHVTEDIYLALKDRFEFADCGPGIVKGLGEMHTYLLLRERQP